MIVSTGRSVYKDPVYSGTVEEGQIRIMRGKDTVRFFFLSFSSFCLIRKIV
jgi:hypothetical protein